MTAKLSSPYYEPPGIHTYGDRTFEWRTLLNTRCYGFNGPNACYSSTCSHNGWLDDSKKQLNKQKMSNLLKSSVKFPANGRIFSDIERLVDDNMTKSSSLSSSSSPSSSISSPSSLSSLTPPSLSPSLTSHLTEQTTVYVYNKIHDERQFHR